MPRLVVEELGITEFRGVRKLASPLKLTEFNVLVGRNNTGKTAILEALYLLNHPSSTDLILYNLAATANGMCLRVLSNLHSGADSLIYGYHGTARITYRLAGQSEVEVKVGHTGGCDLQINNRQPTVNEYAKLLTESYGEFRVFAFYIPDSTTAYECIRETLIRREAWKYLVKHGLHRSIVEELVAPAVYDKFTEVLVEEGSLKLRKEVGEGIGPLYVDVRDLGEGVERTLLAALAVSYAKPKLILWDDVEVALHPTLAEALINWLSSLDAQVVLTTHSVDVLYALLKAYPRNAQAVLLKKTSDDVLYYEALSLEELEDLVEKHIDPRRLAEALEL